RPAAPTRATRRRAPRGPLHDGSGAEPPTADARRGARDLRAPRSASGRARDRDGGGDPVIGRLVLAAAIAAMTPAEAVAADRVYALVVGNNEPPPSPAGDGLSTLRYADDDAVRWAELLQQF